MHVQQNPKLKFDLNKASFHAKKPSNEEKIFMDETHEKLVNSKELVEEIQTML